MNNGLALAFYGVPNGSTTTSDVQLIARSEGVTLQTASAWRALAAVTPRPAPNNQTGAGVGLFNTPGGDYLIAHTWVKDGDPAQPQFTYTRLPRDMMRALNGNFRDLLETAPALPVQASDGALPNMTPPTPREWPMDARVSAVEDLMAQFGEADAFSSVLSVLNAAISKKRLLIYQHDGSTDDRLDIIVGLMALLPAAARADLTFTTELDRSQESSTERVAFSDRNGTGRNSVNWMARINGLEELPWQPYIEQLAALWQGDLPALLRAIDDLGGALDRLPEETDRIGALPTATARYAFYLRVQNDDDALTHDDYITALSDANRLPLAWSRVYAARLLPYALDNKDGDAERLIARQMDADPVLDEQLMAILLKTLEDAPDLVYVFIRHRLGESISPRWLDRLKRAAKQSLAVALDSGEPDLVISWLRLIAREPERFELAGVLREGVVSAASLADTDPAFAQNLVVLVGRFVPDLLADFLKESRFVQALPEPLQSAFAIADRDALAECQSISVNLFMAGLTLAAEQQQTNAFDVGTVERILALADEPSRFKPNFPYTPDHLLDTLAQNGGKWLPSGAMLTLLAYVIQQEQKIRFAAMTENLYQADILAENLAVALIRAEQSVDQALAIVSQMVAAGWLQPAEVIGIYEELLGAWGWDESTQPIMEVLARTVNQNPDIRVDAETLLTLLEAAASLRDESIARVASTTLMQAMLETNTDADDDPETQDAATIAELERVCSLMTWSSTARTALLAWWRAHVQEQPGARLTRYRRLMAGKRVLEDPYEAVQSVAALRRLLGRRDVHQFANDVNITYDVLETLAEAFEPEEKAGSLTFDPDTVRKVLSEFAEDLPQQQRQILANSLRGLAGLIARMGDNRSRAGLGRRGDNLDRQLMTGEQVPHSAVDAMKWIAGFFSGAQGEPEDD